MLLLFSALAMILAAIGIYGVVSYAAGRRTREIGIRIALGAHQTGVVRLVLGQGMRLVGTGIGLGFLAAVLGSRYLESLLFGVPATDPLTLAATSAFLLAVGALACYLPARRASRVDPMMALRYD